MGGQHGGQTRRWEPLAMFRAGDGGSLEQRVATEVKNKGQVVGGGCGALDGDLAAEAGAQREFRNPLESGV